jgi:tRNA(Ile)-lysidine synthase
LEGNKTTMTNSFHLPDDLAERVKELLELIPLHSWSKDVVSAIKSSPEDKSIGIACSGGADSTLCVLLVYAAFPNSRKRMIVAHFNHQLRGEDSNQDEAFVQLLCKKLNLRCVADKANQKSNKADENSLRNLRMNFWKRLEQDEKITHIIQGHHLNDVAETLLWRIPRGVSVDGLIGPKPVSKVGSLVFLRPLIPFTKEHITKALTQCGIPWREDQSNQENLYLRNKMRNTVLPAWKASCDRDLLKGIDSTGELLKQDSIALDFHAEEAYGACRFAEAINLDVLLKYPTATQRRVLTKWISSKVSDSDKLSLLVSKLGDTLGIISENEFKSSQLSEGLVLRKRDHLLLLENHKSTKSIPKIMLPFDSVVYFGSGNQITVQNIQLDKNLFIRITDGQVDQNQEAFLSAKKLGGHIYARSRKDGDHFLPLGAPGNKKVSDWMIDRKWSPKQKIETPVLVDGQDEILWIPGFPPAGRAKVTKDDLRVIRLTYLQLST